MINEYISVNFLKLFDKDKTVTSIHKILYIENDNHLVTTFEKNNKNNNGNGISLTNYFVLNKELFLLKKINDKKKSLHYLIVIIDKEHKEKAVLLREFIYEMASPSYFNKYEHDIIPFLKSLNIVQIKEDNKPKNYVMNLDKNDSYNKLFYNILYSLQKINTYTDKYVLSDLLNIIKDEIPKTTYYNVIKNEIKIDANQFINDKTFLHLKRKKLKDINEVIKFKDEYFERTLIDSLKINFLYIIYKYYCFKNGLATNPGVVILIKLTVDEVIELMEELYDIYYYE